MNDLIRSTVGFRVEPNGERFSKLVGPAITNEDAWRSILRKNGWVDLFMTPENLPTDPHEVISFMGAMDEPLQFLGHYQNGQWIHQNYPMGREVVTEQIVAWRPMGVPSEWSVDIWDEKMSLIGRLWWQGGGHLPDGVIRADSNVPQKVPA